MSKWKVGNVIGWFFRPFNFLLGRWAPIVPLLLALYWFYPTDALNDAYPFGTADDLFVAGMGLWITRGKL
jgi:hypothetical protein